jgi:hypothetical protein
MGEFARQFQGQFCYSGSGPKIFIEFNLDILYMRYLLDRIYKEY